VRDREARALYAAVLATTDAISARSRSSSSPRATC
jgi:hypothetical protein